MKKTIKVDYLARVEGEGALFVHIEGKKVLDVKLKIFEPPRFFEAFLRHRNFLEAPDITARICGICPVAYQMSAVHAMENACQVKIDGVIRALRRLLYCGEWIESHTLHIYMLHAPDFLGYPGAIQMAKDFPQIVERGLKLKKAGNEIVKVLGGREIHPINVKVGGFYRLPSKAEFAPLIETLKWAKEAALETAYWTSTFLFPDFEPDYTFVSLSHPDEYPFNEGRIISNKGLDIDVSDYESFFAEEHVKHSNALHSILRADNRSYFVGPMARFNLNFEKLSPVCQETAKAIGLGKTCRNPFKSIMVRSIETLYACDEALRILTDYEPEERSFVEVNPLAATGYACTEAPRGLLYHRYAIDQNGAILDAKIIPPTSQNQKRIEDDLYAFIENHIDLPKAELTWKCEQAIRNYDPCISCATHFLKLDFIDCPVKCETDI